MRTKKKGKWNIWGEGSGYQEGTEGASYALITVPKNVFTAKPRPKLSPKQITYNIATFYKYAEKNPGKEFMVAQSTRKGLNGYTGEEMASFFVDAGDLAGTAGIPANIKFEEKFLALIEDKEPAPAEKLEAPAVAAPALTKWDALREEMLGKQGKKKPSQLYSRGTKEHQKAIERILDITDNPDMRSLIDDLELSKEFPAFNDSLRERARKVAKETKSSEEIIIAVAEEFAHVNPDRRFPLLKSEKIRAHPRFRRINISAGESQTIQRVYGDNPPLSETQAIEKGVKEIQKDLNISDKAAWTIENLV